MSPVDAFSLTRQARWEVEGTRRAATRYAEAAAAADPSALPSGQRLLREVVPPLTKLIAKAQEEAVEAIGSASGRLSGWQWPIQLLSADKLALITVSVVLRVATAGGEGAVVDVARNVALAVFTEVEYERWVGDKAAAAKAGDLEARNVLAAFRARYPKVDRHVWARWRKKVHAVSTERPSEAIKVQFGSRLVHLMVEACPQHFRVATRILTGNRTQLYVDISEETRQMMGDVEQRAAVSRPLMMPMLIPPIPWRYGGGAPTPTDCRERADTIPQTEGVRSWT